MHLRPRKRDPSLGNILHHVSIYAPFSNRISMDNFRIRAIVNKILLNRDWQIRLYRSAIGLVTINYKPYSSWQICVESKGKMTLDHDMTVPVDRIFLPRAHSTTSKSNHRLRVLVCCCWIIGCTIVFLLLCLSSVALFIVDQVGVRVRVPVRALFRRSLCVHTGSFGPGQHWISGCETRAFWEEHLVAINQSSNYEVRRAFESEHCARVWPAAVFGVRSFGSNHYRFDSDPSQWVR